MNSISLSEANLTELVNRAAAGETVQITRNGEPVAQITPITKTRRAVPAARKPRKPIDLNWLREVTKNMPPQEESGGDFMRRIRDEERY